MRAGARDSIRNTSSRVCFFLPEPRARCRNQPAERTYVRAGQAAPKSETRGLSFTCTTMWFGLFGADGTRRVCLVRPLIQLLLVICVSLPWETLHYYSYCWDYHTFVCILLFVIYYIIICSTLNTLICPCHFFKKYFLLFTACDKRNLLNLLLVSTWLWSVRHSWRIFRLWMLCLFGLCCD